MTDPHALPELEGPLMETLAAAQHDIWSHWMRRMWKVCPRLPSGGRQIPPALVERWTRQESTPYAELSPEEQESDRRVVRQFVLPCLTEA